MRLCCGIWNTVTRFFHWKCRAEKSKLCPALFLFRDPTTKKLLGMIGIHVDDDLILGSKQFFENQVAQLRNMHCYGKWHTSVEGFFHCGRFVQRTGRWIAEVWTE